MASKPKTHLEKARDALARGPGSTDTLAKRARIHSRAMSKALSTLKNKKGEATLKADKKSGERVWTKKSARGR